MSANDPAETLVERIAAFVERPMDYAIWSPSTTASPEALCKALAKAIREGIFEHGPSGGSAEIGRTLASVARWSWRQSLRRSVEAIAKCRGRRER